MPALETPDVTKAQVASIVQAVITVIVAFGADISDEQFIALIGLSGLVAAAINYSDSRIRSARALVAAAGNASMHGQEEGATARGEGQVGASAQRV